MDLTGSRRQSEQPKQAGLGPVDRALLEEAVRETRRQSVYWAGDHPPDTGYDGRGFGSGKLLGEAMRKRDPRELLKGAMTSLEVARKMLTVIERKRDDLETIAERAKDNLKPDLKVYAFPAIRAHWRGDRQRAIAELRHWEEYVAFYRRQIEGEKPVPRDVRLPREPGDDAEELAF